MSWYQLLKSHCVKNKEGDLFGFEKKDTGYSEFSKAGYHVS